MLLFLLKPSVLSLLVTSSVLLIPSTWASTLPRQSSNWPYGPFSVSGTDMKNSRNETIVYAGANWPGHNEVMIPEGLQYQSIETIVSMMKSVGMNAIRLTYAIQMVDEIYENGQDTTVQQSFVSALGQTNGTAVYADFLANNPSFNSSTTRLQVFDAVAAECAKQKIHVHLDNHMSKATWCCSTTDGNSWWGDTYFNTTNWVRGITYMATHAKSWTALTSMSLRNELREPDDNETLVQSSYNWETWYQWVRTGSSAINKANPDIFIFLSGLDFDTWLTPIVEGTALTPGTETYSAADFSGYADKLVLELHNYDNEATSCSSLESSLSSDGYEALGSSSSAVNKFPVVLTEFGFDQTDSSWQGVYTTCIQNYLTQLKAGWFIWVVAGSYYIRSGSQDFDETWGLLTHDWSAWRNPSYVTGGFEPFVNGTVQN